MAEIDVVKKGSKTWLWLLVAVALVFLVWLMMSGRDRTQAEQRIGKGQPLAAVLRPAAPA